MTNKSKYKSEAPNRYAKALLLTCNNDLDLKQTKNDFDDFIKTYNNLDELKLFFQTPLLNPLRKKQILLEILNKMKSPVTNLNTLLLKLGLTSPCSL